MDYALLSFAAVAFLCVVLFLEGGYLLWNSHRGVEALRMQRRLQALSAGGHAVESKLLKRRLYAEGGLIERLMVRVPRVALLDRLLLQSGLSMTVGNFLLYCACGAFAGLILAFVFRLPWWLAPLAVISGGALPLLHVLRARRKRLRAIEQQLPDALELMSRAMRAGHAFSSALQTVGDEAPAPISHEFQIAFDEVNFGVSMPEALTNLAVRVPVADLRFFVIAVSIQRETGGNLAELLDKLAGLMRARFKLLGTIRVLSTEGRFSALILTLLPFCLLAVINLINPKFMAILWKDPAGLVTVQIGLMLMVAGTLWMWRIVKIRV